MGIIKSMRCEGLYTSIEITDNEVIIGGFKNIPFNLIKEVRLYPILESAPTNGGCLKLVTVDNPGLPERDGHSFHISGTDITSGMVLPLGNCFWFNCLSANMCASINKQADEIKTLIESKMPTK